MSGRRGQRERSRPWWGRVVRGRSVRRRASKGRLGTLQTQVALRVQVEASGAWEKTFRTLSFLFRSEC